MFVKFLNQVGDIVNGDYTPYTRELERERPQDPDHIPRGFCSDFIEHHGLSFVNELLVSYPRRLCLLN